MAVDLAAWISAIHGDQIVAGYGDVAFWRLAAELAKRALLITVEVKWAGKGTSGKSGFREEPGGLRKLAEQVIEQIRGKGYDAGALPEAA